ncbi:MAG: ABC transporter permease [Lachnospiraceae bacterium]|jgi:ABC-type dipeptide/oligopeptide/nickel transport system permease subunit|nr:ABC transporter permease [Lachnospiraceae bacterium]MCI9358951.1 ABC transporter permease [Lachnospiraceae bacterium]
MKKYPKSFLCMCGLILVLLLTALAAPFLAPNDPYQTELMYALKGSSAQFPLGTDSLGRCMLSRILYGARTSIFSSLCIIAVVFFLGTGVGVVSGYAGGIADQILTKFITIMQAFPKFILAIAIAGVLGIGIENTIFALCLVEWAEYARMARSLTMGVRQKTYIRAAKVCGESSIKIMARHVFPNIIPPLVVNASLGISAMIMEVAALSYLGVGVESPMAEWGAMMNTGKDYMQTNISLVLIPGAAIFVSAVLFNLFGDKLRDVLDPSPGRQR